MDGTPELVRVELQQRAARPYVWLDVSYNGKHPPTALFDDLRMIGWEPPAPAPPPRSAVDWSTPDETTGEAFSIIDYVVDDVVAAPPGTGERGRWTAGEQTAYLKGLDGVLRRHGLLAPPVDTRPPPPMAPSPVTEVESVAATTTSSADRSSPAEPNADDDRLVHVEAVLVRGAWPIAKDAISSLDVPVKLEQRERTKTVTFRGSKSTTTEMGEVLTTVVPASKVHRITRLLVDADAVVDENAITVGGLRADTLGAFLASPASTHAKAGSSSAPSDPEDATVTLAVTAFMFEHLASVAVSRGGVIVESARVQKQKRMNHRGSVRMAAVPGVRAVIAIAPALVDELMVALAKEGLAIDDPDEVSVVLPRRAPPATAPAEEPPSRSGQERARVRV